MRLAKCCLTLVQKALSRPGATLAAVLSSRPCSRKKRSRRAHPRSAASKRAYPPRRAVRPSCSARRNPAQCNPAQCNAAQRLRKPGKSARALAAPGTARLRTRGRAAGRSGHRHLDDARRHHRRGQTRAAPDRRPLPRNRLGRPVAVHARPARPCGPRQPGPRDGNAARAAAPRARPARLPGGAAQPQGPLRRLIAAGLRSRRAGSRARRDACPQRPGGRHAHRLGAHPFQRNHADHQDPRVPRPPPKTPRSQPAGARTPRRGSAATRLRPCSCARPRLRAAPAQPD